MSYENRSTGARPMRRLTWMMAPWISLALALQGCGSSSSTSGTGSDGTSPTGGVTVLSGSGLGSGSQQYSLCSTTLSKQDFLKGLDGNLVFTASAISHGRSSAQQIGGLIAMLVGNGIDPAKLKDYDLSFASGDYTYKAGDEGYTFSLYYAADLGSAKAGDKIPYNVFDYKSYLTGISFSILSTPNFSYSHGPLYDLIDGSASVTGTSLAAIQAKFKLKTDLINFVLTSQKAYLGQAPRDHDTLLWKMATTAASLTTIQSQFAAGGFGLLFDGTTYTSLYYGIVQTYGSSPALIKKDDTGYYWSLTYEASVVKGDLTMYQSGVASERSSNYTKYYCDNARTNLIGTATHSTDLQSGVFAFADGSKVSYGLSDF